MHLDMQWTYMKLKSAFLLKTNVLLNLITVIITFAFREIYRLSNTCGHGILMLKFW